MPVFTNFAPVSRFGADLGTSNQFAWWTPARAGTWTQVSLTANTWTVSYPNGQTQVFTAAGSFTPSATPGGPPTGAVASIELRAADGTVLATATGLSDLNFSPGDLDFKGELFDAVKLLAASDTFAGHAGGDTFDGYQGNDSLSGGAGDDRLGDLSGSDTYSGGAGNDTIDDFNGVNVVFGDDGNDSIRIFDGDASGGAGDDRVSGSPLGAGRPYTLRGDAGNDTVSGFADNGDIAVFGDEGDDVLVVDGFPAAGAFTVDGGTGTDTAYVGYLSGALTANRIGSVTLTGVERPIIVAKGDVDASALGFGVEVAGGGMSSPLVAIDPNFQEAAASRIRGSAFADTLAGGDRADTIAGGGGDDVMDGGVQGWGLFQFAGGRIPVFFAPTYDLADYSRATRAVTVDLNLTTAQDTGDGRDRLASFEGVIGSAFGDTLTGSAGEANFGRSDDPDRGKFSGNRLSGGDGGDRILGGAWADTLSGDNGTDTLIGGAGGGDSLSGGEGDDRLIGGAGADTMSGGVGGDIFEFSAGDDLIDGGGGGDFLLYAGATGGVTVDLVAQTATGAGGNNTLRNVEHVFGTDSGDLLRGNHLSNSLAGFGGNDTLEGQSGANFLDGGAGDDLLVLVGTVGDYFVTTRAGQPTLVSGPFGVDQVTNIERVQVGGVEMSFADFASRAFNGLRYVASNPDLIASIGTDVERAKQHWLTTGQAEGRSLDAFDPLRYAASNLDLQAQFYIDTAALTRHYITTGRAAGRPTDTFDALQYGAANEDLLLAFGADPSALTRHYVVSGVIEKRPISGFDPLAYGAANDDLARFFGTDSAGLFNHWIKSGVYEDRDTSGFDAVAYLLTYPDLVAAGVTFETARNHWLTVGADQRLRGDELFGREQANHDLATTATGEIRNFTVANRFSADRDWFNADLVGGRSYTITARGADSGGGTLRDPLVEVYDRTGRLVGTADGGGAGRDAAFTFRADGAATPQDYYIVVRASDGGEGTYTVAITQSASAPSEGWVV